MPKTSTDKTGVPLKAFGLVFLGGALGSALRFLVGEFLDTPTTLLAVNLLGAAFLGWVNGSATGPKPRFVSESSRWFWGTGFAGGFTTMSGLALGFVLLSTQAGATIGVVYLLAQLFFGLVVYGSGYYAGKRVWPGE